MSQEKRIAALEKHINPPKECWIVISGPCTPENQPDLSDVPAGMTPTIIWTGVPRAEHTQTTHLR